MARAKKKQNTTNRPARSKGRRNSDQDQVLENEYLMDEEI